MVFYSTNTRHGNLRERGADFFESGNSFDCNSFVRFVCFMLKFTGARSTAFYRRRDLGKVTDDKRNVSRWRCATKSLVHEFNRLTAPRREAGTERRSCRPPRRHFSLGRCEMAGPGQRLNCPNVGLLRLKIPDDLAAIPGQKTGKRKPIDIGAVKSHRSVPHRNIRSTSME